MPPPKLSVARATVRIVSTESRKLISIDLVKDEDAVNARDLVDSIVRIVPAHNTPDGLIESVRSWCLRSKAVKVTVLPKPKGLTIPPEELEKKRRVESTRKVVERLVAESNSGDREKLSQVVQSIMGEVGL